MAQINLDTSALSRINDSNLDSQKERKAILDYLYQLTEQLRYWQNNVEMENMTEEFRQIITGIQNGNTELRVETDKIIARVEDTEGNLSEFTITAEEILQRVENAEGDIGNLSVQADEIAARVEDAEGDVASLQVMADQIAMQVENTQGDVANLQVEADQISQRVEDAEGNATSAVYTAEQALIKAENAEGEVAFLSVEVDEIRSQVGSMDGQTTFVQYEEPEGAEEGDIWMRTGAARWMTLRAMTWAEVGTQAWGAYFNPIPATYIWDGTKWQLVADQKVITEQYTMIIQTQEEITQLATRTEIMNGKITKHETLIQQNADAIKLKASQKDVDGVEEAVAELQVEVDGITQRVEDTEGNVSTLTTKADSIESRVQSAEGDISALEVTTQGLNSSVQNANGEISTLKQRADGIEQTVKGKVDQTVFEQTNNAFDLRVQTVEENSGKAETVTNTAMTLDNTGIHMKTGGTFTVDSGNFDVDENGNVSMLNASVNGELLNSGQPVLTAKNLVVSSTQPTSPVVGMVWVKPVGAVVASFVYNNTSVISFEKMEDAHTLTNLGSATTASGTYTYNVSIPYKVTSNVTATRYLKMTVNGTVLFDAALANNAGTYTLEQSGTLTSWLGNAATLSFTLELHFLSGQDETYLHNVHRLNTGAVELRLTAATNAATGWMATEVQVYNG